MANSVIPNAYFHHIALSVSDFDRSYRFYTEGLGLKQYLRWGEGVHSCAMLDLGDGGCIEMFGGGTPSTETAESPAGGFLHLAIGVDDPAAAYDRALEYGARPKNAPYEACIHDPEKGDFPLFLSFVYGPDGEIIEFFSYRK